MAHILVGVDGSEGGRRALARAVEEGRRTGATVEAVTCWYPPYVNGFESVPHLVDARCALEVQDEAVGALPADAPAVRRTIVQGRPASTLADLARHADLVVVGAGDQRLRSRMVWGSLPRELARHTTTPVEVVGTEVGGAPASVSDPRPARAARHPHRPLRRRHGEPLVVR